MSKYFWGDDPVDFVMVPVGAIWGAILHTVVLSIHGCIDGYIDDDSGFPSRSDLKPMIWISILWGIVHNVNHFVSVAMSLQPNPSKTANHIASRMAGNFDEWAYLYIFFLWVYALFFNYQLAPIFGGVWLFSRFSYGIYYAWYGHFTAFVELSTQPQYQQYYTFYWVMIADFAGYNFIKDVCESTPVLMFPTFLLFHFVTLPLVLGMSSMWAGYISEKAPASSEGESDPLKAPLTNDTENKP